MSRSVFVLLGAMSLSFGSIRKVIWHDRVFMHRQSPARQDPSRDVGRASGMASLVPRLNTPLSSAPERLVFTLALVTGALLVTPRPKIDPLRGSIVWVMLVTQDNRLVLTFLPYWKNSSDSVIGWTSYNSQLYRVHRLYASTVLHPASIKEFIRLRGGTIVIVYVPAAVT